MEQLELEIETEEDRTKRDAIKQRLLELFRLGNEASWTKFLKTEQAQRILNE